MVHWAAGERLEGLQELLHASAGPQAVSGTAGGASAAREHEVQIDFLQHTSSLTAVPLWQGAGSKGRYGGPSRRQNE